MLGKVNLFIKVRGDNNLWASPWEPRDCIGDKRSHAIQIFFHQESVFFARHNHHSTLTNEKKASYILSIDAHGWKSKGGGSSDACQNPWQNYQEPVLKKNLWV